MMPVADKTRIIVQNIRFSKICKNSLNFVANIVLFNSTAW